MNERANELKRLNKKNEEIRAKIRELLTTYMMSEEVIDTELLINELVENEIEQEKLCSEQR